MPSTQPPATPRNSRPPDRTNAERQARLQRRRKEALDILPRYQAITAALQDDAREATAALDRGDIKGAHAVLTRMLSRTVDA